METLDEKPAVVAKKYKLLLLDYYSQVVLFWTILIASVTVVGIFLSMLLMIPWGAIQLTSALYNTARLWHEPAYRSKYLIYWAAVGLVAVLFASNGMLWRVEGTFVAAMILSLFIGCYHTYILHIIYKDTKQNSL